jgi:hypothetical protein
MFINSISRKGTKTLRFKNNYAIFHPRQNAPFDEDLFCEI